MGLIPWLTHQVPSHFFSKIWERRWYGLYHLDRIMTPTKKSKIITGAQIPLSQLRNDAVDNLLGALTIAGHYIIPGNENVALFCSNTDAK